MMSARVFCRKARRIWFGVPLIALLQLLACPAASEQRSSTHVQDVGNPALEPGTLSDARQFYAKQPIYLRPFPHTPVPKGLSDLTAKTCGGCHKAIYDEWRISTHARAWLDDAQFQGELAKPLEDGKNVAWMCVNCHTPLENQLERLVVGLKDGQLDRPTFMANPFFSRELQNDAITCAVCHVKDGVVLGTSGEMTAPHPVAKDALLMGSGVCEQCHQAVADFPSIGLACTFNTGEEYRAGPYDDQGKVCQSCHMPVVNRPITNLGTPSRVSHRHWFGGSLIPKKPEFAAELEPLLAHYPDGLTLRWTQLPATMPADGRITVALEAQNAEAGHLLPSGDPERFILITLTVKDEKGALRGEKQWRIGTVYQWWPEVKKLEDNRLKPLEVRRYSHTFQVSDAVSLVLEVTASKWRINKENMAYHKLEGRYVAGRTFKTLTAHISTR